MNKKEKKICMEIYERNCQRIKYYLWKNYGWLSEADTFDVMQNMWKALCENIHKLSKWEDKSQWSWLVVVVRNEVHDLGRARERQFNLEGKAQMQHENSNHGSGNPVQDAVIEKAMAMEILGKLSQREKEILFSEYLDMPIPDVSELRDNASVCKSYRARKKLKEIMEEGGMDE
jgi:DNA-directed RNA polymerase specialized sigma24 family protein